MHCLSFNKPAITHPVVASLDHPLFAFGGKRVMNKIKKEITLFPRSEERVDQRSVVGVSNRRQP
jgi:hypothetical protein